MTHYQAVERVVDLLDPAKNVLFNSTTEQARALLAEGDVEAIRRLDGHFALVATRGKSVLLARSIGRPLRYFIAKRAEGPCLIAADRIDAIHHYLHEQGLADQFHPSYTRMAPAHYVTEVALLGCPDPNPTYRRFLPLRRAALLASRPAGHRRSLHSACAARRGDEVAVAAGIRRPHRRLLFRRHRQRLHLPCYLPRHAASRHEPGSTQGVHSVGGRRRRRSCPGPAAFWRRWGWRSCWSRHQGSPAPTSTGEAVRTTEDYKPLDIQSASMALALCRGIRNRYPEWRHHRRRRRRREPERSYPIEENPELTIRSVLNNLMLYQEGWGVDSIKHSLTYTGV